MEYLTAQELADLWGISRRRVQKLCAEGRLRGAVKKANLWLIPQGTNKPKDLSNK
jgi:excisionase family DNA binding protein